MVSIPACHAGDPGSIPGLGAFFFVGYKFTMKIHRQTCTFRARGLVVMIVACQVIDPGSIPGERIFCVSC